MARSGNMPTVMYQAETFSEPRIVTSAASGRRRAAWRERAGLADQWPGGWRGGGRPAASWLTPPPAIESGAGGDAFPRNDPR